MSAARSPVSPREDSGPMAPGSPAAHEAAAHTAPLFVIEPRRGWRGFGLDEIWRYRELLYFLVWRDVKVRYKQTVLGAGWAVLQPLLTMLLVTLVFGRLGGLDRHVTGSYALFAYAGILPWTFCAGAVSQGSQSLLSSSHLISKVYFPRLLVPLAAVAAGLVDLAISTLTMLGLVVAHHQRLEARALLLPVFLGAAALTATGAVTLLSSLTVAYRDFRHLTPFLVQTWMLASPVAYPLESVPGRFRLLYALNPMVGPIAGCRAALLGGPFPWEPILISTLSAAVLLLLGAAYFRTVERRFADII